MITTIRPSKVLVTGAGGLLGYALQQIAPQYPEYEWIFVTRKMMGDLSSPTRVRLMFDAYNPEYVIHTAARVGGIHINSEHPEKMYYENIIMNAAMVHESSIRNIHKFIGFGSTCAYSDQETELRDDNIHAGEPYHMNYGYGYAKRMMDVHLQTARKEYGLDYTYVIPCTMFGENDLFDTKNGHVIASLIVKASLPELRVWGDGSARRQVIYSKDLASIVVGLLKSSKRRVLVGSPDEVSIKDMVNSIIKHMDFRGKTVWETDKPNGQLRRPLVKPYCDCKFTPFDTAIQQTCKWYRDNLNHIRQ